MLTLFFIHRYIINEEKSFYGKKSVLRIRAADRADTATFSCTASNPYGKASEGLRLIVQGVPDPPDDIVFSDIRSTSVVAKWNIPYSGNSDISSYTLSYHPLSGKWFPTLRLWTEGAVAWDALWAVASFRSRVLS